MKEAMGSDDSEKWREAIKKELSAMKEVKV